ncbi:MAG: protein kinase [Planctomycetes bacterium]|nr:protein kinase [Planctomycetota bacterium]
MNPSAPRDNAEADERVLALVDEFLERREAGEDLTPEGFAAEHPEVAEQLRPYLAGVLLIDRACELGSDNATGKLAPGQTELPAIEGYELIEEIGRGGMGVVYRALQVSTKRIVALKVMLAGAFASRSARRRFEREVELAARLRHQNIVTVLEGGHVADRPYFAMEYVSGTQLGRYLSQALPDLRSTLKMFERICEAVDYAHQRGVIHRDLKPANVLIDDEGEPRILDFGLAKPCERAGVEEGLTPQVAPHGLVMGTLFYLSPEQAVGVPEEIDVRTDVYALGVTLFEALTGSLPFDTSGRPAEVIQRLLETPPTPPSSLSTRVDAELETVILKALEKDKARRYQSAREMADDIHRYLEGEPIRARQSSSLYVLRKKLRKHRLAAGVGMAAVALGVLGLLGGTWWKAREVARARRDALGTQQGLESQAPSLYLGPAQSLFERHPELPEAALVQAQALHRRAEVSYEALLFLKDVLTDNPSRWACRALLAEFYQAAGNTAQADALRMRALREAPDTAEAWYLRSFATLDPQRAVQYAQEAVARDPAHVLAWQRLTQLRLDTGDLDGALSGAKTLIELGAAVSRWTFFRGVVFARQGRFQKAIEEYSRVNAYTHLAHTYRRIKEYDKSVECYGKALTGSGDTAGAMWHYYQRATPLWILGRTDEALADYERFRIQYGRPWYSDARAFLILQQLGRPDEAQRILESARREVQEAWLRQILRCLAGQLSPDELVADGRARNNPEQLCEAYYYAGEVHLLMDDRAEAREYFQLCVQTGVEFDPDSGMGTPMNEWELARWRLDTLPADKSATSHP